MCLACTCRCLRSRRRVLGVASVCVQCTAITCSTAVSTVALHQTTKGWHEAEGDKDTTPQHGTAQHHTTPVRTETVSSLAERHSTPTKQNCRPKGGRTPGYGARVWQGMHMPSNAKDTTTASVLMFRGAQGASSPTQNRPGLRGRMHALRSTGACIQEAPLLVGAHP